MGKLLFGCIKWSEFRDSDTHNQFLPTGRSRGCTAWSFPDAGALMMENLKCPQFLQPPSGWALFSSDPCVPAGGVAELAKSGPVVVRGVFFLPYSGWKCVQRMWYVKMMWMLWKNTIRKRQGNQDRSDFNKADFTIVYCKNLYIYLFI